MSGTLLLMMGAAVAPCHSTTAPAAVPSNTYGPSLSGRADPGAAAPSCREPVAAVRDPVAVAADAPAGHPRFRFSLDAGGGDDHIRSPTALTAVTRTNTYAYEVFGPVIPASQTVLFKDPNGAFGLTSSAISEQPGPALRARSWSSEETAGVSFAPAGLDRGGWRFDGGLTLQQFALKQDLGGVAYPGSPAAFTGPELHTQVPGSCFFFSNGLSSNTVCDNDITRTSVQTGYRIYANPAVAAGSAGRLSNGYDVGSVQYDNIDQRSRRYGLDAAASYGLTITTLPIRIDIRPRAALTAHWYDIDEHQYIRSTDAPSPADPSGSDVFNDLYSRKATGPGFRGSAGLELDGGLVRTWPVTWSLFGDAGRELVDLRVLDRDGAARRLDSHSDVSDFGASVTYAITRAVSATLGAQQRKEFYLSTTFGPPGAPGTMLKDQTLVALRTAQYQLYSFSLGYSF